MGDRRRGAVALALAATLGGCLEGPASDATSSSTSSSTGSSSSSTGTDTTGSSGGASDTSTDTTGSTATAGSSTTEPLPTCSDGQKNGSETDIDCGEGCAPCDVGEGCGAPADCQSGKCEGGVCVAPECSKDSDCAVLSGPCTTGTCDKVKGSCVSVPANEGLPCEDGDLCTTKDTCVTGTCTPSGMIDCTEFDSPCTKGVCDPDSGSCASLDQPDGSTCDDGDGCTFNETCLQGACAAPDGEGAIFYDDFSSPVGWTVTAPWEIGPAKASAMGEGGADPGTDHTETDDNGLAGTAIGGLDPLAAHPSVCLTSPSFDTSAALGSLWLSYWRHLHSPATPAVTSKIEVWNGLAWKTVQTGYVATTNDLTWSFQKLNITGNAAKDFRVRICMERKQGSPDFAGWSLDDLVVARTACTP